MRFFRRLLPAALAILSFTLPGSALGQAPLSPDKAFSLTVTREADGDLAFDEEPLEAPPRVVDEDADEGNAPAPRTVRPIAVG